MKEDRKAGIRVEITVRPTRKEHGRLSVVVAA
jgi:hypothetical protein